MRLPVAPLSLAAVALAAIASAALRGQEPPAWSDAERLALVQYWSAPGRYDVKPLEDPKGPWKVRLTPEASEWLWNYNKARGISKGPPGTVPGPQNAQQVAWEKWIDQKVAYDRWLAACDAARQNRTLGVPGEDPLPVPTPDACPSDLAALAGEPPPFANCVRPLVHHIKFEDDEFTYRDNVVIRPRYAYYRFAQGVNSEGVSIKTMPADEVAALVEKAGITPSEAKVFKAVSILEGGFDAVNTYDTGYVSIGFIQFASLREGGGSLGEMLVKYKQEDPENFNADFRHYGIDVTPKGLLRVVIPRAGEVQEGPLANDTIIEDPRLVAVFGRAAKRTPFRVAQLRAAKALFYPGDVTVTLKLRDRTLAGKVKDVIKSEAGMAILMDRKVNTGRMGNLTEVMLDIARANDLRSFADLAKYERDIVTPLVYRVNTLKDPTLSQPGR